MQNYANTAIQQVGFNLSLENTPISQFLN